jgi:hypothetical protein
MDHWSQRTEAFGQEGSAATQSMKALFDLAHQMEGTISASALRSFVEVAKIDHLVYKFEIYKIFMCLSQKNEGDFADHAHCRLGKWYYEGEGRDCFSKLPGYHEMEAPHKRFHDSGSAALRRFREGNYAHGFDAIADMEKPAWKCSPAWNASRRAARVTPVCCAIPPHDGCIADLTLLPPRG